MSNESIDDGLNRESQLEQDLERSERLTRGLIQAVPLALLIIDSRGTVLSVNPQASRLLGWLPKEIAGRKLQTVLYKSTVDFPLASDFSAATFETSVVTKSEKVIYVELAISSLSRDPDAWLVSLKDITERHNIETFKRNFIQMISHDLRSPLNSLSIFLEMVVEERLGPVSNVIKKQGTYAQSSCRRLLNLVEDLLTAETLASGELKLDMRLVLSGSVLDAAANAMMDMANSKNVKIEIEGRNLEVWCDEERLVQVLINFLSNALKFTPVGEEIRLSAKELPNGIEFSVNDRGPGIPEGENEFVFERFFQGANNGAGSGFGLGLAICSEIVKAHSGLIGVRKNGDQGSSFWFMVPLQQL